MLLSAWKYLPCRHIGDFLFGNTENAVPETFSVSLVSRRNTAEGAQILHAVLFPRPLLCQGGGDHRRFIRKNLWRYFSHLRGPYSLPRHRELTPIFAISLTSRLLFLCDTLASNLHCYLQSCSQQLDSSQLTFGGTRR